MGNVMGAGGVYSSDLITESGCGDSDKTILDQYVLEVIRVCQYLVRDVGIM